MSARRKVLEMARRADCIRIDNCISRKSVPQNKLKSKGNLRLAVGFFSASNDPYDGYLFSRYGRPRKRLGKDLPACERRLSILRPSALEGFPGRGPIPFDLSHGRFSFGRAAVMPEGRSGRLRLVHRPSSFFTLCQARTFPCRFCFKPLRTAFRSEAEGVYSRIRLIASSASYSLRGITMRSP